MGILHVSVCGGRSEGGREVELESKQERRPRGQSRDWDMEERGTSTAGI